MYVLLIVVLSLVVLALLYYFAIRPALFTWGATPAEIQKSYLGDKIVIKPHFIATRALTIQAPAAEVWQWIIQIGSARAGWYSLDWIDNAGVPSSREILPEFQKIEPDYFIPFTPDQENGMWVKEYREPDYILWWDKKGKGTWGW